MTTSHRQLTLTVKGESAARVIKLSKEALWYPWLFSTSARNLSSKGYFG